MAMQGIASPAPRPKVLGRPKALGSHRPGRAGEPAGGESVGASESLDDVPHRPRLPSYPPVGPTDRLPDLYGSLSALLGINVELAVAWYQTGTLRGAGSGWSDSAPEQRVRVLARDPIAIGLYGVIC